MGSVNNELISKLVDCLKYKFSNVFSPFYWWFDGDCVIVKPYKVYGGAYHLYLDYSLFMPNFAFRLKNEIGYELKMVRWLLDYLSLNNVPIVKITINNIY